MKKALSLFLTLLFVASMVPTMVLTSSAVTICSYGEHDFGEDGINCICSICGAENDGTQIKVGATFEYGSYPQSKVTDTNLIAALNNIDAEWISYDYYIGGTTSDYTQYKDVTYEGTKYRAVIFTSYRPYNTSSSTNSSAQRGSGYIPGNVYWFKYEPLTWKVLDPTTGLSMCTSIIDSQQFSHEFYTGTQTRDGEECYSNSYKHSDIRTFLNGTFYNTAFASNEQDGLVATTISSNDTKSSYSEGNDDVTDKVFLLSYSDMINASYGFSSSANTYDTARKFYGTDYAKCQGLYISSHTLSVGVSPFLLRSVGNESNEVCECSNYGYLDNRNDVYFVNEGVLPAICVANLQSLLVQHTASEPVQENVVEPTCTVGGSCVEVVYCADCGEELSRTPTTLSPLGHDYIQHDAQEPTCTDSGWYEYETCSRCDFSTYHEASPLSENLTHTFNDGEYTFMPTGKDWGVKTYTCIVCKEIDTEEVEPRCDYTTSNYTLTIQNAQDVNLIRFAKGTYTTSKELRAAEDLVTVNSSVIAGKLDVENNLNYDMPDGGVYTVFVRYNDDEGGVNGNTYLFQIDLSSMTHELVGNGLLLTIKNLYGVKDIHIAKGHYETYRQVKNSEGYITGINMSYVGNVHDYTYPINYIHYAEEYTICIRHTDGSDDTILYYAPKVEMPQAVVNGLQITISNLRGIKTIRTATGEYSTAREVKNAVGVRNFSAKNAIKGADIFTIQYSTAMEGINTLSIEYENGYTAVVQVNIQHKEPSYTTNGDSIVFNNVDIDDLYIIRWAPGKVTKAGYFKTTSGNKYAKITPNIDGTYDVSRTSTGGVWDVENKTFTISGLSGQYSFLVQYGDGSINIYTSLNF